LTLFGELRYHAAGGWQGHDPGRPFLFD